MLAVYISILLLTSVTDFQGKAEGIANSGVIKVTALFALELLIPANRKGYFFQAKNMKIGKVFMGRSVKKKKKKKKWRRDLSLSD